MVLWSVQCSCHMGIPMRHYAEEMFDNQVWSQCNITELQTSYLSDKIYSSFQMLLLLITLCTSLWYKSFNRALLVFALHNCVALNYNVCKPLMWCLLIYMIWYVFVTNGSFCKTSICTQWVWAANMLSNTMLEIEMSAVIETGETFGRKNKWSMYGTQGSIYFDVLN